jgi:predicted PurR-regulated permease PerM
MIVVKPQPPRTPISAEVFYARTVALLAASLLGLLLYQILLPFFAPLAWAVFIAFLLYPLHRWLVEKLRGRENVSAALLTLATFLILIGPLTAVGAAFAAQAAELLRFAQRLATDHRLSELADLASLPVLGTMLKWLQDSLGVSLDQIQQWAVEGARTVLGFLASLGGKVFLGTLGTVVGFVLMMFILFFAIRDGQRMLVTLRALIPMPAKHKARLFDHLAAVTRALVYGTVVTSLGQGALIAVGFAIIDLPSPIVFGVLAALFAIVPMAGTPVVWVPAVIWLAVEQRWVGAIFLLVWGGGVATIDNFVRPILVAGRAEVGALMVFIGVLGGISAFGPIGVIAGPLVLALVIALVRFSLEVRQTETS